MDYYYLDALNNGHGPVSEDQLRVLLKKTNLHVWRKGLTDWTPANGLPEFTRVKTPPTDPSLAEMLGLCRGILADGVVTEEESAVLRDWVHGHPHLATQWPGDVLAGRLQDIYADGVVSPEERADLKTLLDHVVANPPAPQAVCQACPDGIFDQPPPHVSFHGKNFCFAGQFVFGTLERCRRVVEQRAGQVQFEPQWDTHYLVIGAVEHNQAAVNRVRSLKELGAPCKIVAEEHWSAQLTAAR